MRFIGAMKSHNFPYEIWGLVELHRISCRVEEASAGSAPSNPAAGEPSHDRGAYVRPSKERWEIIFRRFCWGGGELVRRNLRNLTSLHPSLSLICLSLLTFLTRDMSISSSPSPLFVASSFWCRPFYVVFVHRGRSVLLYIYLAPPVSAGVALTVVKRALQSILMSVCLGTALLPDGGAAPEEAPSRPPLAVAWFCCLLG